MTRTRTASVLNPSTSAASVIYPETKDIPRLDEEPLKVLPVQWTHIDPAAPNRTPIRIVTLGQFIVYLPTAQGLQTTVWRDDRTRVLLKCLLAAPAYWLSREQLIAFLWPELDVASGQDALRHALSRLRRTLEPWRVAYGQSQYLASDRETVWLVRTPEDEGRLRMWVDRDHFEWFAHTALQHLEQMPDTQQMRLGQQLAAQALQLYVDHFLPADLHVRWAQATRTRCRRLWLTLLWQLTNVALMKRQFDQAQLLLGQLVEAMPDNEGATSQLMQVQALRGQRGDALRTYRTLASHLASEFGATPATELQQLADAIRSGNIALDTVSPYLNGAVLYSEAIDTN